MGPDGNTYELQLKVCLSHLLQRQILRQCLDLVALLNQDRECQSPIDENGHVMTEQQWVVCLSLLRMLY